VRPALELATLTNPETPLGVPTTEWLARAAQVAVASFLAAVLTEIYLCGISVLVQKY
jgi:hypothetical protein